MLWASTNRFFWLVLSKTTIAWKEERKANQNEKKNVIRCQSHQRSTCSFYVRKLRAQLFWCLHFRFLLYWHKPSGAKAARKKLVKLTIGVNLTDILCATFLYESFTQSVFVLTFFVWIFLAQKYWRKCAHKMLVKLTLRTKGKRRK